MTLGSLAFIKTTGELVLIASYPQAEKHARGLMPCDLSGTAVQVYRPLATQDGIRHELELLPIELLETAEARFNREYEEMFELQSKARVKKAESQLTDKLPATDMPTLN